MSYEDVQIDAPLAGAPSSPRDEQGSPSRGVSTPQDGTINLVLSGSAAAASWAAPHGRVAATFLNDAAIGLRSVLTLARPLPGQRALGTSPDLALSLAVSETPAAYHAGCPPWLGQIVILARRAGAALEREFSALWPHRGQARLAAGVLASSVILACVGFGVLLGSVAPSVSGKGDTSVAARLAGPDLRGSGRAQEQAVGAPVAKRGAVVRQSAPGAAKAAQKAEALRPIPPGERGALPVGKGMWLWLPDRAEGGNAQAIVARAKATGLTHLYARTGSSKSGFYAQEFLNSLLPVAHANGIRVYGWDFPYLFDPAADAARGVAAATYTTPDGHRIDGFVADIETQSEGTQVTGAAALAYGTMLRHGVGMDYPLIACVPRPSKHLSWYPYGDVTAAFDAIAPMVYWLNREPVGDVIEAMRVLSVWNKPIIPVGQAYDGAAEGGRPGVPPPAELQAFMKTAEDLGATGVSFWSWQHADQPAWDAIRDAGQFTLPAGPGPFNVGQIRAYQSLLTSLGFKVPVNGIWDGAMAASVSSYQQKAGLPVTGIIDEATRGLLLTPFTPPIRPISG